ncbi:MULTISPECIES: response regulator [Nostocales]|uniref:Chemotaxis protein CheY n=3 Tax=Nostocales TaxID=1161 RepID=A0A0C1QW36_9CYAN|nr:response regulator [Tolypothrix bouteillei]KAF3884524.1 response regulator [Tolypothrix bouteillei VB521301]
MDNFGTFTKLRPSSLLRHLYSASESTCLQVHSNSVTWSIYLEQGRITYATHSVEPFDRLERHLRRLSHQINSITGEVRVQLRLMFEPDAQTQSTEHTARQEQTITPPLPPEYQAICWLVSERYLHSTQAAMLIQELVKEVLEAFLSIQQGTYQLTNSLYRVPVICKLDAEKIVERCQQRLHIWRSLAPHISSPYQRPYPVIKTTERAPTISGLDPGLTEWMKGFSLRHLAVIVNQDELVLTRNLYPYIANGTVLLHEPDPPFDKLPTTYTEISKTPIYLPEPNKKAAQKAALPGSNISGDKAGTPTKIENLANHQERVPTATQKETVPELTTLNKTDAEAEQIPSTPTTSTVSRKIYKVVSVDDSPTILREISRFLEDESFSVVTISDPLKAVMTIIRHKPDLILLDLNMEGMDGYELCRLVRNNSMFKRTPIIMVTGSKGIVDKVRARLVGASGYLTKPFTRADLLKMVFMHLA